MAKKGSAAAKAAPEKPVKVKEAKQRKADAIDGPSAAQPPASKKQKKAAQQAVKEQPSKAAAAAEPAAGDKGKKKSKGGSEIDELFGQLQKPKAKAAEAAAAAEQTQDKAAAAPPKVQGSKDDIFGTETGKLRKRTEEGYAIYNEEELGFNKKGGDTDLCPFDCDCCF